MQGEGSQPVCVPELGCFPRSCPVKGVERSSEGALPPDLTSLLRGIHTGCGREVVVAAAIGEIDHLSSQETLLNQHRPAGSLCSGKWEGPVRSGLQEARKIFLFASNAKTTHRLISPKVSWFSLTSELRRPGQNREIQRQDLHPLTPLR